MSTGKLSESVYRAIYLDACCAGEKASRSVNPKPIFVKDSSGSAAVRRDSNCEAWKFPDGNVGTAMVSIQPANCGFARWLLAQGYAKNVHFRRGAIVYALYEGQSLEREAAYAMAFANRVVAANLPIRVEITITYC